jgi:hypothetical protein
MHWGLAKYFLLVAAALMALAVYGQRQALHIESDAAALSQRSQEAAAAYTESLEQHHGQSELQLLDEKRALMLRALNWKRASLIGFGLAVLAAFAAWVARELHRFREAAMQVDHPGGGK